MKPSKEPQVQAWGYEAKSSENTYTWFKLGLGDSARREKFDDELLYQGPDHVEHPRNMTYEKIATDYLREFYIFLLEQIKKQVGSTTLSLLNLHFVLAVPAGWPDLCRQRILDCAEDAGFATREGDRISSIAEPEAAALAAFTKYEKTDTQGTILEVRTIIISPSAPPPPFPSFPRKSLD